MKSEYQQRIKYISRVLVSSLIIFSTILVSAHASIKNKVAICDLNQACSSNRDAINYALSQALGAESDVILVNTILNRTSIIEVRQHDFDGAELPGLIAITAQEVQVANTAGHSASFALANFIEDPITATLEDSSVILDYVNGNPTVLLEHFYGLPHTLNVNGASVRTISLSLESAISAAFEEYQQRLLDNVSISGNVKVAANFRNIFSAEIGASFTGESVTELEVLFKATANANEAPWGVLTKVWRNGTRGLKSQITGIALLDNGNIVFVIPVTENGTVDLAALLNTTFRTSSSVNQGSLRGWFAGINLNVSIHSCSSQNCSVTVTDIDTEAP